MKQYHKNPRQITDKQFKKLNDTLLRLGDLSGIVHDLNSDEIIGGNQRARAFNINDCEIVIEHELPEPDEQGSVAFGYVIWQGNRYAYRAVRWTPAQCEEANIVANKAGGTWDFDILANEFEIGDLFEWGFEPFEFGMVDGEAEQEESNYSRKIEAPTYEPSERKPSISELYNDERTKALIAEIDTAAGISEEEKAFLRIAAQRHTVLRFDRVADYYAHSGPELQPLMEDSALVIIDFNRAIELGFVNLTKAIAEMVEDEYGYD